MFEIVLAQVTPMATPVHASIDGVVRATVDHEAWEKPTAIGAVVVGALAAIATGVLAFFTWKLAKETTELAKQSSKATDFEALREQRSARPIVVATLSIPPFVYLLNKGSTAFRVSVSGYDSQRQVRSNFFQIIGPKESVKTDITVNNSDYAKKIRIRYHDAFENKYITEYKALNQGLAFPIFRLPSLGGSQPRRWSEQVTWKVEHFERIPDVPDEEVDPVPEDKG